MAVYEGARPRTIATRRAAERAPARRRVAPTGRAGACRAGRARAVRDPGAPRGRTAWPSCWAAIVVAFMLAFFSLAQEVRVSATTYDIGRLQVEQDRLQARIQELDSDLSRLGREPAVRKLGLDGGLGQLGEPVVLPAR